VPIADRTNEIDMTEKANSFSRADISWPKSLR
jgi:hypothetical protein